MAAPRPRVRQSRSVGRVLPSGSGQLLPTPRLAGRLGRLQSGTSFPSRSQIPVGLQAISEALGSAEAMDNVARLG
jgi:hypothetical protein